MDKKGVIFEWFSTIYRMILVSFIALVVLGSSYVFYSYDIDIKNSEALILTKSLVDCVSKKGFIDIEKMKENEEQGIINYCINSGDVKDRFYVRIWVFNKDGVQIEKFEDGDSGALWVKDLFDKSKFDSTSFIKHYKTGYFKEIFPVYYRVNGEDFNGNLEMEVLVRNEK